MLRLNRKKTITVFAFFLLLITGTTYKKATSNGNQNRDLSVYTIEVEEGRLPSLISTSGELQAEKSINVNPHRQGIIEEVYVQEGDKVTKGQLLAKIESRDFQYRLNQLTAEFENAKASYERRKQLFVEGGISNEKYDEFKKSFQVSKSKLQQIQVEESELLIKAPFKGTITARYADPGTFVSQSTATSNSEGSMNKSVVEISQGIVVISKVPESEIGRIDIGQESSIRVEAFPDERFNAFVTEIAPRAVKSNNVTSFEVKLSLVKPPQKLRIGMTADVEFKTGKSSLSTIVPTVAIVTEKGESGLLIVGKNNEAIFQKVELGLSSGDKTTIIKGISPGEKVFIDIPPWSQRKQK